MPKPYAPTDLPIRRPDARRLHGYPTPGGIIWRDLSDPDREDWAEHKLARVIWEERDAAEASMERDAELARALNADGALADSLDAAARRAARRERLR